MPRRSWSGCAGPVARGRASPAHAESGVALLERARNNCPVGLEKTAHGGKMRSQEHPGQYDILLNSMLKGASGNYVFLFPAHKYTRSRRSWQHQKRSGARGGPYAPGTDSQAVGPRTHPSGPRAPESWVGWAFAAGQPIDDVHGALYPDARFAEKVETSSGKRQVPYYARGSPMMTRRRRASSRRNPLGFAYRDWR